MFTNMIKACGGKKINACGDKKINACGGKKINACGDKKIRVFICEQSELLSRSLYHFIHSNIS